MGFSIQEAKNDDILLLKELIPYARYYGLKKLFAGNSRIMTFTLCHDNTGVLGFCVYLQMEHCMETASLCYIDIKPWHRGCGFGTILLRKSLAILKDRGIAAVDFELIKGQDDGSFFKRIGCSKKSERYYLKYDFSVLSGSKIVKGAEKARSELSCVKKFEELPENVKKAFRKELMEKRRKADICAIKDTTCTRFFQKDGKILSFISFSRDENGDLFQKELYMANDQDAARGFPAMVLSVFLDEKESLKDARVILYMNTEENKKACEAGFGIPDVTVDTDVYVI